MDNSKEIEAAVELLKANGYSVTNKKKLPMKLPCVCGRKRTSTWTGPDYYVYRCECGFKVKGKTMRELRENWNKAVTEEMEKQLSFDFEEEE